MGTTTPSATSACTEAANYPKGELKGETVICPCHGSTYDLKTGDFLKGPTKKGEPKYDLKIENNDIMINL